MKERSTKEFLAIHGVVCSKCAGQFSSVDDTIVGGSHYYHLKCDNCGEEFDFSTYDFKLHPKGTSEATFWINRINEDK